MLVRTTLAAAVVAATLAASASPAPAECDRTKPNLTPDSRYVINGAEVYDKQTNLTWQRCAIGRQWTDGQGCVGQAQRMPWDEAVKQANGPWRLPTREELETLVSPTCRAPALNQQAFPVDDFWFWSSTENGAADAWFVNFNAGYTFYIKRTSSFDVRLVRTGK